jgi:hypothetical protein
MYERYQQMTGKPAINISSFARKYDFSLVVTYAVGSKAFSGT